MDQRDRGWLIRKIGPARHAYFLRLARGDADRALALYSYDVRLRDALRPELEVLEITLRLSYHAAIEGNHAGRPVWLLDPNLPVRAILRNRADKTLRRLSLGDITAAEAIEELNFGFWRQLTAATYEHVFWVPYLRHAYPRGTRRYEVHKAVAQTVWLRNRVHHYNSVLELPLMVHFETMLWLLDRLSPELGWERRQVSSLPEAIGQVDVPE